jgi:hypothetical protein
MNIFYGEYVEGCNGSTLNYLNLSVKNLQGVENLYKFKKFNIFENLINF